MLRPTHGPSAWRSPRTIGLRQTRVDAWRVYAVLFVVLGHSEVAVGWLLDGWLFGLQTAMHAVGRVAVPLFLVFAGHHLGPRLMRARHVATTWHYERRMLGLFVLSSALYWLFDAAKLVRASGLHGLYVFAARFITQPAAVAPPRLHLWFLLSLMATVMFAAALLTRNRVRLFAGVSAVLFAASISLGAYAPMIGLPTAPALSVLGAFLEAPLFFALGLGLALLTPIPRQVGAGLALILAGLALSASELLWLQSYWHDRIFHVGLLAGTVPLAAGAGLLAVRPGATIVERWTAPIAAFVPVVYINHVLFLELLQPRPGQFPRALVRTLLPIGTAACAFAGAWAIARLRVRAGRGRRPAVAAAPTVAAP
jgi:surface polysaccharide O-acyltransferase-like enzyme